MMGKVVDLRPDENPDRVLDKCKGVFQDVLVLGWDKDGEMIATATTPLSEQSIVYLIDVFKHNLLSGAYDELD